MMCARITFLLLACLICDTAHAARAKKVPCPKYIGDLDTGLVKRVKGNYKCFDTLKKADAQGFVMINEPQPTPTVTTPIGPINFSGSTKTNTAPFTISRVPALVTYNYTGSSNFSIVTRFVLGNKYGDLLVNEIGSISGTTRIYEAGTYYLDVSAEGPWTVTISQ